MDVDSDQNNSQSSSDSVHTWSTDGNDFDVLFTPWSDGEESNSEQEPQPGCSFWDNGQPAKNNGLFILHVYRVC